MKKFLVSIFLALMFCVNTFAQEYKTHKVKQGETIESIAKVYMVTPFDIYALNPDAKLNFKPNTVLIIPKSKVRKTPVETKETKLLSYKSHKVKRKETLYSISKKYNVSIDDIKKHNTRLYSENLRKGDKINIPQFGEVTVVNTLENTIKKYKVLPKEGKWRVAYKFGISVPELEALNPNIGETLQEGQEINVPNIANNKEKVVEEDAYGYYTVLPKEGFYRLKLKLGMTQEELESLNPGLKESGLKVGMILKVNKTASSEASVDNVELSTLATKISNFDTKRLAVMLPFRTHRVDFDSIEEAKETVKRDGYMNISVDFHTGVLMALDSAKQLGISTKLDVFDTKARTSEINKIVTTRDFSNYDAVIGPLKGDVLEQLSIGLKRDDVAVVSPFIKPKNLYKNVFQTIPSDKLLQQKMIQFIKADTLPKEIIIIADSKSRATSNKLKAEFPSASQIFSRKDKEGKEQFYILQGDLLPKLKEGRTIVFLETSNEGFVSNVSSMLNALNGKTELVKEEKEIEREIILVTTNRNKAFEGSNISNYDLSNLRFHYPSVNRPYNTEIENSFVLKYKKEYGIEPNKYATRGFDLTLDLLLRLATQEDVFEIDSDVETQYVENKFRYSKTPFGGYTNETAYIIKYEDLQIVEVKF